MVEPIDSIDDPRLEDYRHVAEPAWLRDQGVFVAEGRLVVQRLLERDTFRIKSILLTPAAHAAIRSAIGAATVYVVPQAVLNEVTGINFHRGCLAIVHRPPESTIQDLIGGRWLLALEGVGNPDNVGGLFRVAAAFGVGGIVVDQATGDPLYRKSIRTAMGWTLQVPFVRDRAWPDSLRILSRAGFQILALTPRPAAVPLAEVRPGSGRFALIAGSEGSGLSDQALACADMQVRIPIAPEVDSLNVTVATGIALAALTSRRK